MRIMRVALLIAVALVAAPRAQSDADAKLKEIMMPKDGTMKVEEMVPALQQFIRDYPTYPRLNTVYSNLLMFASMPMKEPDKVLALADEALAKFPTDPSVRRYALTAKVRALKAQKKDEAVKELATKALATETDPGLLQSLAQADPDNGLKLFEKAIAERRKNPNTTASPTLDDLNWSYAQSLVRSGRKDEATKYFEDALDRAQKSVADLEALPERDPKRGQLPSLRRALGGRYQTMASTLTASGDYEKALEYIDLAEKYADPAQGSSQFDNLRATVYAKTGKPDLELDAYARSFGASMDPKTRDKIVELAAKTGKKPADIFDRARAFRREKSQAFKPFALQTMDGEAVALDSLKAKAILVNFFFPT